MLFHPEEYKNPFELFQAIPLGEKTIPHYGLDSPRNEENSITARTVVICGLPSSIQTDFQLAGLFANSKDIKPIRVEINKNPDGKVRDCGVVEFSSKAEAQMIVEKYKFPHPTIYLKLLAVMFWPILST